MTHFKNKISIYIQALIVLFFLNGCTMEETEPTLDETSEITETVEDSLSNNEVKNLFERPVNRRRTLDVTATAYNSVERQTKKGNPFLAAWGDVLEPGERAIAVSRDLIALGLDHNEEVEIKGLEGDYIVKDKMNKRWRKKIDIYMGLDIDAALKWGKRNVEISYNKVDNPNDKFSKNQ